MVPVTVQLLKPVDEMKLELVEIRGNRVILKWTQVADVTGARPLDQADFQNFVYAFSDRRSYLNASMNLKTNFSCSHYIKMALEILLVSLRLASYQI